MSHRRPPPPLLPPGCELVDTHCHLDMAAFQDDLELVISAARSQGVRRMITIGIDLPSSRRAIDIAATHEGIFATVGLHPHDAAAATQAALDHLADLASNPSVVAYGEIGLDYVKNYAPPELQRKVFERQLSLARDLDLPVIIHDRAAHDHTLELLHRTGPFPRGGVMHCFSGDVALARATIDLGFHISIPGVVTFATAQQLQEVVRSIALDHILLETDGPFLAPVPYRGKRNEPALLLYTAGMIADLKGLPIEEVARVTTANAVRLFHLATGPEQ